MLIRIMCEQKIQKPKNQFQSSLLPSFGEPVPIISEGWGRLQKNICALGS
jgi:hypothetical protein